MIYASYSLPQKLFMLQQAEEGEAFTVLCTLWDCELRRISEHTLELRKDNTYLGIVWFDEVLYGIPVKGKVGLE